MTSEGLQEGGMPLNILSEYYGLNSNALCLGRCYLPSKHTGQQLMPKTDSQYLDAWLSINSIAQSLYKRDYLWVIVVD